MTDRDVPETDQQVERAEGSEKVQRLTRRLDHTIPDHDILH